MEFGEDQALPRGWILVEAEAPQLPGSLLMLRGRDKARERCHESGLLQGRELNTLRSWQRSLWEPRGGSFKPIASLPSSLKSQHAAAAAAAPHPRALGHHSQDTPKFLLTLLVPTSPGSMGTIPPQIPQNSCSHHSYPTSPGPTGTILRTPQNSCSHPSCLRSLGSTSTSPSRTPQNSC